MLSDITGWGHGVITAQVIAIAIAVIFAWSGSMKLAYRKDAARAMAKFGLSSRRNLRAPIFACLTEWTVSALLVLGATGSFVPVWVGLGAAVALLGAFTFLIARALARHERFPCMCFGTANSEVGPFDVVRNLVLIAAAGIGIAAGVAPAGDPLEGATLVVATACVIATLATTLVVSQGVRLWRSLVDPFAAPRDSLEPAGIYDGHKLPTLDARDGR